MSRLLVFIFLFSTTYSLTAQTSPYGLALDTLAQWVEESPSYFADLPQRAADPNAELETEEYLLLYYSSAYLEGYSPYGEKIAVSAVYDLMEQDDYEGAIAMTQGMLQEQPACARYHRLMGIAYDALGDTSNANIYFDRYVNLISVPFYSGTGESPDSAFVVRCVDDEYLIIGEMGLVSSGQALINEDGIPYDILTVSEEGSEETRELYFNIYQPYVLGLSKQFEGMFETEELTKKEKRKRKREERKREKKNKKDGQ